MLSKSIVENTNNLHFLCEEIVIASQQLMNSCTHQIIQGFVSLDLKFLRLVVCTFFFLFVNFLQHKNLSHTYLLWLCISSLCLIFLYGPRLNLRYIHLVIRKPLFCFSFINGSFFIVYLDHSILPTHSCLHPFPLFLFRKIGF